MIDATPGGETLPPPRTHAQPTHDDIYRRLGAGQERFQAMDEKLDLIIIAQTAMQSQIEEVKQTADKTKEVVEAWDTARNVARFLKWIAGVIAALTAIGVAAKLTIVELLR